jgi:hypothetical protein
VQEHVHILTYRARSFQEHNSPLGSTSNPAARHSITIDRAGNQDLA